MYNKNKKEPLPSKYYENLMISKNKFLSTCNF